MIKTLRYAVMLTYLVVGSIAGLLVCVLRPFHPNNTMVAARIFAAARPLLGLKRVIRGQENLLTGESCIYIANHQHNLDLFVLGCMVQPGTVTIGKTALKYIPFFGQLFWLSGNLFIDRGNNEKAVQTMQKANQLIREKKLSVWVFPEGTRNKGHNLLPFKKGAFLTAMELGLPIVPICTSSYPTGIQLNRLNAGEVHIEVLPAISLEGLGKDDLPMLMQTCHQQMQDTIARLDAEIPA
ncbi:MAG: 1-acylglycerol-3-phosphate O-acyltransferase [Oceanospirillaceae bacterium]|nr:1-acylglycerol-3-phosphate O-acyltransferase [Oceanospirillaceae bacterium]MCP5350645.1 1-acylglycerol-3-phosphate O-acyltransferase [Oceanospirillaceae bacterium]